MPEFWSPYNNLAGKLGSSPAVDVDLDELIDCIFALEKGAYSALRKETRLIIDSNGRSANLNEQLSGLLKDAAEKHDELVSGYERIKINTRFGKLYRPRRSSRWSD